MAEQKLEMLDTVRGKIVMVKQTKLGLCDLNGDVLVYPERYIPLTPKLEEIITDYWLQKFNT